MRNTLRKSRSVFTSLVLLGVFAVVMVYGPLQSRAYAPTNAITITNNSNGEIRHVFLSAPDQNNWGSDQLGNSVIAANGGSFTVGNVSCNGPTIKVIAENHDGCFYYQVVSCADNASWTISSSDTPDCGN